MSDIEVLVLDHGTHVSHPKGHQEENEDLYTTALRELQEETGLELVVISIEPVKSINYEFEDNGEVISKTVHFFAGIINRHLQVRLSDEHVGYKWLNIDKAVRYITHEGDKLALAYGKMWLFEHDEAALFLANNEGKLRV